MARNEEKSLTLFNRWQTFKTQFHSSKSTLTLFHFHKSLFHKLFHSYIHLFFLSYVSGLGNRRPLLAQDCDSLVDAEKWRRDLVKDITKKISSIHNGIVYRILNIVYSINNGRPIVFLSAPIILSSYRHCYRPIGPLS